jgi:hypothetical protein
LSSVASLPRVPLRFTRGYSQEIPLGFNPEIPFFYRFHTTKKIIETTFNYFLSIPLPIWLIEFSTNHF